MEDIGVKIDDTQDNQDNLILQDCKSINIKDEKQMSTKDIEKLEEAKLKAKYPMAGGAGHSAFLQKKLAKGQKYFDSGDYQMARQSSTSNVAKARQIQPPLFNFGTGDAIPTPESVPVRKTSIIQPKFHPPPSASQQT